MPLARLPDGLPRDPPHMAAAIPPLGPSQDLTPILIKLLSFTLAMVVLPIGSYFLSRDYYFGEKNLTPPAIIAATMANVILIGFVYVAMKEDNEDSRVEEEKKKQ